ncbi:MAG TPA: hypothetical protein VLF71_02475 [Candidatus Saccharimonadales bacterium]|nr:hypothetical protein [Candidatus Saccharimonadales bacterium]
MIYTYPGAEGGSQGTTAIDTLAAMYAEGLVVPRGTHLLFTIEALGQAFTRGDLGMVDQSAKRDYVQKAFAGLMAVGLMEVERGPRLDTNNHPISTYSLTPEFPGVIADYNDTYLSILSDVLDEDPEAVEHNMLAALSGGYRLVDVPLSRVPRTISDRSKNIGEGGVVRRALAGLATFHGLEEAVANVITEQVIKAHDTIYPYGSRSRANARKHTGQEDEQ